MKKRMLSLLITGLFLFGLVGCSSKNKNNEIEIPKLTTSINADQNFYAKAYPNINKEEVIIELKNGFQKNIKAIKIETKQYDSQNKQVNSTSIIAEYLLDGQKYVNSIPIDVNAKVEKVDINISIVESSTNQETGTLYNDKIKTHTSIQKTTNNVYYEFTNTSGFTLTDVELMLVYYKDETPLICEPLEPGIIMQIGSQTSGYDSIPPVVTKEDGLVSLDFNKVEIIINKAR